MASITTDVTRDLVLPFLDPESLTRCVCASRSFARGVREWIVAGLCPREPLSLERHVTTFACLALLYDPAIKHHYVDGKPLLLSNIILSACDKTFTTFDRLALDLREALFEFEKCVRGFRSDYRRKMSPAILAPSAEKFVKVMVEDHEGRVCFYTAFESGHKCSLVENEICVDWNRYNRYALEKFKTFALRTFKKRFSSRRLFHPVWEQYFFPDEVDETVDWERATGKFMHITDKLDNFLAGFVICTDHVAPIPQIADIRHIAQRFFFSLNQLLGIFLHSVLVAENKFTTSLMAAIDDDGIHALDIIVNISKWCMPQVDVHSKAREERNSRSACVCELYCEHCGHDSLSRCNYHENTRFYGEARLCKDCFTLYTL